MPTYSLSDVCQKARMGISFDGPTAQRDASNLEFYLADMERILCSLKVGDHDKVLTYPRGPITISMDVYKVYCTNAAGKTNRIYLKFFLTKRGAVIASFKAE